jgi:uncharacterized protein
MENHYLLSHPFAQAAFGGLLIGLASWLLLASLGKVAGISGITASALFEPKNSERLWRIMFLVGLIAGGGLASLLWIEPATVAPINTSSLMAAVAGILVGFGTVLGSGCTSGHGVCGIGRRSLRSLVATVIFMVAGIATTTIVHLAQS